MLSREKHRLHNLNKHANRYLLENANSKRFFHLPVDEIINRTVLTIIAIFVDLLNLMKPEEQNKMKNMNFQEKSRIYANVFIKKDRLVYFGIFLIFLSLLFISFELKNELKIFFGIILKVSFNIRCTCI